jgi:hypothetical protein
VNTGATKSTFSWKKVAVLAFLAVRRRFRCATRQKASRAAHAHPPLLLTPGTPLTARPARATFSTTQGAQISLGALLMTVVGGGSPGIAAANPGLGKWLTGAIGLPVVRTGLQGVARARR